MDFQLITPLVGAPHQSCFSFFKPNTTVTVPVTVEIVDPNDPSTAIFSHTTTIGGVQTIGASGQTNDISDFIGNELLPAAQALNNGQKVRIEGTLQIDEDYIFGVAPSSGSENMIIMGAGSKIIVEGGHKLGFESADIHTCSGTWEGVLVESQAELYMNKSRLSDATVGVEMLDLAKFDMFRTTFSGNNIGVGAFGANPKSIDFNSEWSNTNFVQIIDGQTGIHLENVVNFDDTGTGLKLLMANLVTGIHSENSNISISGYNIQDCQIGINEVSGNDFITCDFCTISGCDYGIKTIGTSVFTVMNSSFSRNNFDIYKNPQAANEITSIDENNFFGSQEYNASGINVFAQAFPSDLASSISLNQSLYALHYNVHLSGLGKGNHNWFIQDNAIMEKLGDGGEGANVYFLDIGNSSILENGDVVSTGQNFVIDGGGDNDILENTAEGGITNVSLDGSRLSSVVCNNFSRADFSGSAFPAVVPSNIYIENDCANSDIRSNAMSQSNRDGLGQYNLAYGNVFNSYANTRRQEFKGNIFDDSQVGSPKARNYGPSFLAAQNQYLVADDNVQGDEHYPYFDSAFDEWFVIPPNSDEDYICENGGGIVGDEPINEVLLKAVENGLALQDAGLTEYYEEEVAFDSRLKLYRHLVLLDEIEALPSGYTPLFDSLSTDDFAPFVAFERAYLKAAEASPIMVAKYDTITILQAEIRAIKWLEQDTATGQVTIIDTQQAVYDEKMGQLKQLAREHGALLNAQQMQIDTLLPALYYINESAASQLTQSGQNQYKVNKLLLKRYHSGFTGYDTTELQTLIAIADQCPVEGGEAVHTARALRAEAEDMPQEYDDECVSGLSYRENTGPKQATTILPHRLVVSPNPASAELMVYLPEGFEGDEILITNMLGHQIGRIPANGARQVSLNTVSWPSGFYFVTAGQGFQTKIIISH